MPVAPTCQTSNVNFFTRLSGSLGTYIRLGGCCCVPVSPSRGENLPTRGDHTINHPGDSIDGSLAARRSERCVPNSRRALLSERTSGGL